jgi:hypothetical protein
MNLTLQDIHADYIKEFPHKKDISYKYYSEIVFAVIRAIFTRLLMHNEVFVFPNMSMGFLSIVKVKPMILNTFANVKDKSVFKPYTLKYINKIINIATNGYMFVLKWDKRLAYCKVYRARYYKFVMGREFKRKMELHIKKTYSNSDMESFDAPLKSL